MQSYGVGMIINLLRKRIGQASETAYVHPHSEVLTLYVAGTHVLGIRPPAHFFHLTTDAGSGRIASLILKRSTVNLLQLRVLHIGTECFLYGFQICFVAVSGDLDPATDTTSRIPHKIHCPVCAASADQVTDNQLCVGINSDPRPNVTPTDFFLFGANIFCFCADVCPYLIALKATHANVANMAVMVGHTRAAKVNEQLCNG